MSEAPFSCDRLPVFPGSFRFPPFHPKPTDLPGSPLAATNERFRFDPASLWRNDDEN